MNRILATLLLLIALVLHGQAQDGADRSLFLRAQRVMLFEEGPEQVLYWEFPDSTGLRATAPEHIRAVIDYQDSLRWALGEVTFMAAVDLQAKQDQDSALAVETMDGDAYNAMLVHTGRAGRVRPMNALEGEVLNYQASRYPLFSHPTEFHGFVTQHTSGRIRFFFAASDTEWPPHPTLILQRLEKDLLQGWTLIGHLHNHFNQRHDHYVGTLAPSLADAQYYGMLVERFGLQKAYITNGLHTVELKADELGAFAAHGDDE